MSSAHVSRQDGASVCVALLPHWLATSKDDKRRQVLTIAMRESKIAALVLQ